MIKEISQVQLVLVGWTVMKSAASSQANLCTPELVWVCFVQKFQEEDSRKKESLIKKAQLVTVNPSYSPQRQVEQLKTQSKKVKFKNHVDELSIRSMKSAPACQHV